jgi:hypothetical protein
VKTTVGAIDGFSVSVGANVVGVRVITATGAFVGDSVGRRVTSSSSSLELSVGLCVGEKVGS